MKIPKPLAVFPVSETIKKVIVNKLEFFKIRFVTGCAKCHKEGYKCLAVWPPQFHILLELFRRVAVDINEVEKPSVFSVPAYLKRPVKDMQRLLKQDLVVSDHRFLH